MSKPRKNNDDRKHPIKPCRVRPSPLPVAALERYLDFVMYRKTMETLNMAPDPKDASPDALAKHRAYISGRTAVLSEFSTYFKTVVEYLNAEYAQKPMTLAEMLDALADPALYHRD